MEITEPRQATGKLYHIVIGTRGSAVKVNYIFFPTMNSVPGSLFFSTVTIELETSVLARKIAMLVTDINGMKNHNVGHRN